MSQSYLFRLNKNKVQFSFAKYSFYGFPHLEFLNILTYKFYYVIIQL